MNTDLYILEKDTFILKEEFSLLISENLNSTFNMDYNSTYGELYDDGDIFISTVELSNLLGSLSEDDFSLIADSLREDPYGHINDVLSYFINDSAPVCISNIGFNVRVHLNSDYLSFVIEIETFDYSDDKSTNFKD